MLEQWRPVVGHEGRYEVSNLGNVASLNYRRMGYRKNLIPGLDSSGYPQVNLLGKTALVHNLVYRAFVGEKPRLLQINHKDGDKTNPALSNLECVSAAENIRHSFKMGTHVPPRGERSGMSKLTEASVAIIRSCYENKVRVSVLSERFGVHEATIFRVVAGKSWHHSLKGRVNLSGA